MIDLIQKRLENYRPANPVEEEQAIREILQEIALYALWRADFFEIAAFQGGTSLRVLHQLPRFSEDLDFMLKSPATAFKWGDYLQPMRAVLREFGLQSEVLDRRRMDQAVRQAVRKDNSIGNQLNLRFQQGQQNRVLQIKLEIDVDPPNGSLFAYRYLDFPLDFEVCHQNLASNLALKIHALLCRPYIKGRDWYDFNWYVKQGVRPNLPHLQAALIQHGPWQGQPLTVDDAWLAKTLGEKIAAVDWSAAATDVERFLNSAERQSLKLWSTRFFNARLGQLQSNAAS